MIWGKMQSVFPPEISVFSNLGEKQRRFSPKSSKIVYLGESVIIFLPDLSKISFFGGKEKPIRKKEGISQLRYPLCFEFSLRSEEHEA